MSKNDLKNFYLLAGLFLLIVNSCRCPLNKTDEIAQYFTGLPFEMRSITLPRFPEHTVNIKNFGALSDGYTDNTVAINNAISDCAKAGGGKVVVPAGIWITGPIRLESNINFHLEKGAILMFSGKFEDYPLIETSWEGLPAVRRASPISGKNLENIAITGEGIIDGAGDRWRPVLKNEMTNVQWEELICSGGVLREGYGTTVWWPSENAANGRELVKSLEKNPNSTLEDYANAREFLRPVLISLIECKNVLLDGPTFQNSPAWNIHPLLCENVVIRNIKVRNPWYSTNGDGLDIESCKNVIVYNCTFDVGDDAICIKSGKNEFGRNRGVASENIVIADCIVYHGHGGVTIGSEMSGGVRNVFIKDCQFMGTEVGLRFKTTRGRGGVVENIFINGVLMAHIKTDAIRFNMFYDNKAASLDEKIDTPDYRNRPVVTEGTPQFRKIYIDDVVCLDAGRAIFLRGLPEMAISKIEITNSYISSKYGLLSIDAEDIRLRNVEIKSSKRPAYSLYNNKNIVISGGNLPKDKGSFLRLSGERTDGILLEGYDSLAIKRLVILDDEVKAGALIY